MKQILFKILLFLFFLKSLECSSQNRDVTKDSIRVGKISQNFFNWYISAAKAGKHAEFNPVEVPDKNGMTTLDFSVYLKNLSKQAFSDSLINAEKQSYEDCLENLAKIKYTEFLKLSDLDAFEKISCDFNNYYRWTGGQEMFDTYEVKQVRYVNEKMVVTGSLAYLGDDAAMHRRITTTFILQNGFWRILSIQY